MTLVQHPRRTRRPHPMLILLLVAATLPVLAMARVVTTAFEDTARPADAIVVLGAAATNGRPGAVFEARLAHARALYEAGIAPTIVTLGGRGEGQQRSEAESGRTWLVGEGVPEEDVVAIGVGGDTLSSLEAAAAAGSWGEVVLVSDPWHLYRSRIMASDVGLEVAGLSPVESGPNVESRRRIAFNVVRETVAVVAYRTATVADAVRTLAGRVIGAMGG